MFRQLQTLPRLGELGRLRKVLGNVRDQVRWAASPSARSRDTHRLTELQGPGDVFEFARGTLGVTQIRSEILAFCDYAAGHEPRTVCEIGTSGGGNNLLLSRLLPSTRLLIGVDLFVYNRLKLRLFRPAGQRHVFITGSSYDPRTAGRVRRALSGTGIDLLFIDGDHSWTGVLADFRTYRPLLSDHALVAFHDIQPDGRAQGSADGIYSGGVPDLWRQLRSLYPSREFVAEPDQRGFGIGVLTYDQDVALPELRQSQ